MPTKLDDYLVEASAAAQAATKYEALGVTDVAREYREIEQLWRTLADGVRRREQQSTMRAQRPVSIATDVVQLGSRTPR